MEKTEHELLKEANDVLRTAYQITERRGKDTNWDGFKMQLERVLKEQHRYLYPTKQQIRLRKLNKINEQNSK